MVGLLVCFSSFLVGTDAEDDGILLSLDRAS